MFLDFYKIREQPFGVTPDPRFLFLGESHREALASLFCGIEADQGFMALIAHPGMGKTMLTFQLLERLQRTARTVFLFQTQCNSRELLQYVLNDLEIDSTGMDVVSLHNKLNEVLYREKQAGRRFILAIDEAQNLDPAVLETIRLFSDFETPRAKLLQIVLIGQPQLARKLADPALLQLAQRITMFARLEPLDPEGTSRYIAHRLKVAGYGGDSLFTPGALRIIAERSQGIPRNINSLCFSALSLGCAMGRQRIDAEIIGEVIADLDLESLNKPAIKPLATNPQMTTDSALSYRRGSNSRLGQLALGAVGLAASVALGLVMMSSSSSRMTRFWPHQAEAAATVRNPSPPPEGLAEAPSAPSQISSPSDKLDDNPTGELAFLSSSDDPKTITVVVQPGDTLRQITLRTLGQYNNKLIEKIQSLNTVMTDPNQIEAHQEIRLPRPTSVITPSTDGANDISEKN